MVVMWDAFYTPRKLARNQQEKIAHLIWDLLQLLEWQLSVDQINQSKINNIADNRLKHYKKILQNQLEELQQEVMYIELNIRRISGLAPCTFNAQAGVCPAE